MEFNTSLLHSNLLEDASGATLTPIYQSSAFMHETADELGDIFANKAMGYSYTRVGNPTVSAFENRMTKLEGGVASIACASGMAALTNAFLGILKSGDEIVASTSLYGGSIDLFREFESFGITTHYVDNNDIDAFESNINDKTRLVFAETIGNPKLDVTDIKAIAKLAHMHDIPLVIDNTVATAYLVKPIMLGADIVVNSTSKYINGSSNAISGVLTDGGKFKWNLDKYPLMREYLKYGPYAFTAKLRNGLFRNIGACLAPQTAFYNMLGMETLGLRMQRQCDNALEIASWLENSYPEFEVNYPGLVSSPWHDIADKQFSNGFGAIITLRAGSRQRAFDIIDKLSLPLNVSNIGDTKTLVLHPASTISLHSTPKQQADAGVYDDLIRISVGIEDAVDLIEDLKKALKGE